MFPTLICCVSSQTTDTVLYNTKEMQRHNINDFLYLESKVHRPPDCNRRTLQIHKQDLKNIVFT